MKLEETILKNSKDLVKMDLGKMHYEDDSVYKEQWEDNLRRVGWAEAQ